MTTTAMRSIVPVSGSTIPNARRSACPIVGGRPTYVSPTANVTAAPMIGATSRIAIKETPPATIGPHVVGRGPSWPLNHTWRRWSGTWRDAASPTMSTK
jgi:hypothetical protein